MTNGKESVQSKDRQLLSLSDQLYRQSKIDEENRRLKKKSKSDGGLGKKGKKSSKKSDLAGIDDIDDDIYPTVKVKRGGELPEGVTESGNEDNEDDQIGKKKKKKYDPHRALNIDLNEKPNQPPPPPKESIPPPPLVSTEKPKKSKKKKTTEPSKPKHKRERSDYRELVSPVDDEEKRETVTPPLPVVEEKPKKKKTKEKKPPPPPTVDANNSAPLLLDIMSDDINPIQQFNEQDTFKLAAQSDDLIIVSSAFSFLNHPIHFQNYSITPSATLAQLDVTFLLKNQTSFIIDHIDIHIIDSMSSKLLNTTSANRISFPSISLFPHSQNYLHIYFAINAISFSQKLKTTFTYSINVRSTIFSFSFYLSLFILEI
jgi:hypothetical protein